MRMMLIIPEPMSGALFEGTAVRKVSRVRHLITITLNSKFKYEFKSKFGMKFTRDGELF